MEKQAEIRVPSMEERLANLKKLIGVRKLNKETVTAGLSQGCYPCKGEDKWVAIAVSTDEEWRALCRAMGNPGWSKDERFSDQFRCWQNQGELDKLIREVMSISIIQE